MYAVIKTGGKQYKVSVGETVQIEKIDGDKGSEIAFPEILLIADNDNVFVGDPIVKGASVKGTVVTQTKDKKIYVRKFKAKSRYRRTQGHRQQVTQVRITEIKAK